MKVICIDATPRLESHKDIFPDLKEGEVYTASQCIFNKGAYAIAELPMCKDGTIASFMKSRFIPTSYIDELENKKEFIELTISTNRHYSQQ